MNAIIPVKPLINRSDKRLFQKEALSVIEDLERVNASFLFYLFDDSDQRTYREIYREYSDMWIQVIDQIINTRKLKFILLDRTWFYNNYAPEI